MRDILEHPVSFLLSQLCALAFVLAWALFWYRLRARGYRGTRIARYIAASCAAGALLTAGLVAVLDRSPRLPRPGDQAEWFHLGIGAAAAFAAALLLLLLRLLPEQGPRDARGGFRNGWLLVSRAFTVATGLVAAATLFFLVQAVRTRGDHWGPLTALFAFLTWQYVRITRPLRDRAEASRSADVVARTDPRPPVLYLRSFRDEARVFDYLEPGPRLRNPWLPIGGHLSIDNYLTATVERLVGPFVALGNPDDVFAPAGAARSYADSRSWREQFVALAARCAAIVVAPASAGGLAWELGYLRAGGESAKLHILFGRCVYERVEGTRRNRILWLGTLPEPFRWEAFREALTAMGYALPDSPPEPGTVLSFDAHGRVARITTRCSTPEHYVQAIQARSAESHP